MERSLRHIVIACAVLVLVIGCATVKTRQEMLTDAGFRLVLATNAQQLAHLKTLPADRFTMTVRNGTNYFVIPNLQTNALYVGQYAQYVTYERLRFKNEQIEARGNDAEWADRATDSAVWDSFGDWGGP
jgi:hypothetical protein